MSKNTICPACGNEYGQGFATMDPDLDCLPCAMYLQGKREGIEAAAKKVEELLMQPIRLIPMTPTKEKETRDDIRRGYQSALRVIRALLQTEARAETGEKE